MPSAQWASLALAAAVGCASATSRQSEATSRPSDTAAPRDVAIPPPVEGEVVPNDGSSPAFGSMVNTSGSAAASPGIYQVAFPPLEEEHEGYGSGQAMLDLAQASSSVSLTQTGDVGSLEIEFDIEYDDRLRGPMMLEVPTLTSSDAEREDKLVAHVPIRISVRSSDGRILIPASEALLETGEKHRGGIYQRSLPNEGSLVPSGVSSMTGEPCDEFGLMFDFRAGEEVRAAVRVQTKSSSVCTSWSTADPPVFWRTHVGVTP